MDLKETYNQIAEDWHQDHLADDWWISSTEKFASLLAPGDSVLDIGCGSGIKSKFLTARGLIVTGIDLSDQMITIAKREVPEATFAVMDVRDLSKLGNMFDGVFAQAVLLHIPKAEIPAMLAVMKARLKPDGYLYLAVKERGPGKPEEEIVREDDYGYEYQRFFSYFTAPELEELLQNGKLEIVFSTIQPSGKTNWIQMIAKK